jgi:hypothetical protein
MLFQNQNDEKKKALELNQAYKEVFLSVSGQKVLRDIASQCNLDTSTFNKDAMITSFQEGRRTIALYILGHLNTSSYEFLRQDVVDDRLAEMM